VGEDVNGGNEMDKTKIIILIIIILIAIVFGIITYKYFPEYIFNPYLRKY